MSDMYVRRRTLQLSSHCLSCLHLEFLWFSGWSSLATTRGPGKAYKSITEFQKCLTTKWKDGLFSLNSWKSFYSSVETCSRICVCYFENPFWIGYTMYISLYTDWSFQKINCWELEELAAVMWGTRYRQLNVHLRSSTVRTLTKLSVRLFKSLIARKCGTLS